MSGNKGSSQIHQFKIHLKAQNRLGPRLMKYGSIIGLVLLLTSNIGFSQVVGTPTQKTADVTLHTASNEKGPLRGGAAFIVKGPFQYTLDPAAKQDYPSFQNPQYLTFQIQPASVGAGKGGVNLKSGQGSWYARGMNPTEPNIVRIPLDADDADGIETLKIRLSHAYEFAFPGIVAGSYIVCSPPYHLGDKAREIMDAKKKKIAEHKISTGPSVPGQNEEINSKPLPPRENSQP